MRWTAEKTSNGPRGLLPSRAWLGSQPQASVRSAASEAAIFGRLLGNRATKQQQQPGRRGGGGQQSEGSPPQT